MRRTIAIVLVVAAVIAGLWLLSRHTRDTTNKIPAPTQHTIDSLKENEPKFQRAQDSIRRVVVYDTLKASRAEAAAEKARASAKAEQQRADSLAVVAGTSTDSAAAWHSAYDARTAEAVQLREAVAEKDSAYRSERSARLALSTAYGADTVRRLKIEGVNRDLVKAIAKLEVPCRVIGPIPCPSRTVSAITGGVLGVIARNQVKR